MQSKTPRIFLPWCFAVEAAYSVVIILPLILHAYRRILFVLCFHPDRAGPPEPSVGQLHAEVVAVAVGLLLIVQDDLGGGTEGDVVAAVLDDGDAADADVGLHAVEDGEVLPIGAGDGLAHVVAIDTEVDVDAASHGPCGVAHHVGEGALGAQGVEDGLGGVFGSPDPRNAGVTAGIGAVGIHTAVHAVVVVTAADDTHFRASAEGVLPVATLTGEVGGSAGVAHVLDGVTAGHDLDEGGDELHGEGHEVGGGGEEVGIVGAGQHVVAGQEGGQLLGGELAVTDTSDHLGVTVAEVQHQIVVEGVGVPLVAQEGGELPFLAILMGLLLDEIPLGGVAYPQLGGAHAAMVVVGQHREVKPRQVADVAEIGVDIGTAVGQVGVAVHLAHQRDILQCWGIVASLGGVHAGYEGGAVLAVPRVDGVGEGLGTVGGVVALGQILVGMVHENTSISESGYGGIVAYFGGIVKRSSRAG